MNSFITSPLRNQQFSFPFKIPAETFKIPKKSYFFFFLKFFCWYFYLGGLGNNFDVNHPVFIGALGNTIRSSGYVFFVVPIIEVSPWPGGSPTNFRPTAEMGYQVRFPYISGRCRILMSSTQSRMYVQKSQPETSLSAVFL